MSLAMFLADVHLGMRNNCPIHDKHLREYFTQVIIPTCVEKGVTNIIVCGDLFHNRTSLNLNLWSLWLTEVFKVLEENRIHLHVVLGNHDVYFKNTNKVNAPSLLLGHMPEVSIYEKPRDVTIGGTTFAMIPWINEENRQEVYEYIESTSAPIAIAHLELRGYAMRPGENCEHGIPGSLFERFVRVFTGHFHLQSDDGRIRYMGCPTEHSLGEAGQPIGFHLFDTSTLDLEFFPNDNKLYVDVTYIGKGTVVPNVEGKFVRIFNRSNDKKFDAFVSGLEAHLKPHKVECFDLTEQAQEVAVADLKDLESLTVIIDNIVAADLNLEPEMKSRVIKIAQELYQASQSK